MRCQSSISLLLSDNASQRARPTCKLSLANVSAFTNLNSEGSTKDSDAMEVDVPSLAVSIPTLVNWGEVTPVPFPSSQSPPGKHALLRPYTPLSKESSNIPMFQESRDPPSPTEPPPPRKRTRTSALLPKPSRSHRLSLVPLRNVPSRMPRSSSLLLSSPQSSPTPPSQPNPCELFTYSFPTLSVPTVTNGSQTTKLPSIVHASPPAPVLSIRKRIPSSPPGLRRRKPTASELKINKDLYRTLIYTLSARFSEDLANMIGSGSHPDDDRSMVKAQLALQDALLADRIAWYLKSNGEDIGLISMDVANIEKENPSNSQICSRPGSIMAYQQLVSSLLMRRRSEARALRYAKKSGDRVRKPSKLAESTLIYSPTPI